MQINGVGKKLICQNGNETFVRGGSGKYSRSVSTTKTN